MLPPAPVAGKPAPVVPAAGVLAEIAAQGAHVADLRAGNHCRRLPQQRVAFADQRVLGDFGEGGERPDLDAAGDFSDTLERIDALEVDHRLGGLGAVLEPAVGVLAACQQPGLALQPGRELSGILHRGGLVEFDVRHHVVG